MMHVDVPRVGTTAIATCWFAACLDELALAQLELATELPAAFNRWLSVFFTEHALDSQSKWHTANLLSQVPFGQLIDSTLFFSASALVIMLA
jgi:hypothetical protein